MAKAAPITAPAAARPGRSFATTARDSLESIVVAFTLAFIFRAFIVEAFVIPTGSMAPTLYGQQVTHTCSTCGYEYAHDVGQALAAPRVTDLTLRCPNCGSERDEVPVRQLIKPSSGDRILVHKWPFSVGGDIGPERWDVTVFKDPHNGTVNYIKRMVGKPGEILEIIHGDIYTAPLDVVREKDPGLIDEMLRLRHDLYQHAHGGLILTPEQIGPRYAAINRRLMPYLEIQRKVVDAPVAQKSLWFTVYHHSFLPNYGHTNVRPESRVGWSARLATVEWFDVDSLDAGQVPQRLRDALGAAGVDLTDAPVVTVEKPGARWRIDNLLAVHDENRLAVYDAAAAAAWDTSQRTIRFKSDSDRPLNIRFTGKPMDEFYGYNYMHNSKHPSQQRVPVGDLRLAFTWTPDAGDGGLVARMNRHTDFFNARIQMDGTVEIEQVWPGGSKPIGAQKLEPFSHGVPVDIEFTNVDFRVSLRINGEEVLASTDEQYAPDLVELLRRNGEDPDATLPSQVHIGAWNLQCRLDHVKLDRDVYYRSSPMLERTSAPVPGVPVTRSELSNNPFYRWPGWGTQGWPIMLQDGEYPEYFMLGDNSPASKDSRLWWEIGPHLEHRGDQYRIGTVPEDQLIGQAFFVYWPSGYRRPWTANIGIIPNFGRMRWIR